MSTTVDILCFYYHLYNQLFKVKYDFNLETLIYVGTWTSQITQIFSHLKLWIAVARHNFKWLKIWIEYLSAIRVKVNYQIMYSVERSDVTGNTFE